jgi:hypothetical protein
MGLLFLEETHALKKDRYDPGLQLGRWLLGVVVPLSFDPKLSSQKGRLGWQHVR